MSAALSGVVDIPESDYHRHRSLSYSGAKLLLPPNTPALYRYRMDNPIHKDVWDFGHAVHAELLGKGQPIRYISEKSWQTNVAKAEKAKAHAADEIPLLDKDRGVIEGMVAAVRAHPLAHRLFEEGEPEKSIFWQDADTGIGMRSRLDWTTTRGSRVYCVDYKTSTTANPARFGKIAADFGYFIQDVFYRDGMVNVGMHEDPAFLFAIQEKTPPYLVSVIELDEEARAVGYQQMRQAIAIYERCVIENDWPGYSPGVSTASLPYWFIKQLEDATA